MQQLSENIINATIISVMLLLVWHWLSSKKINFKDKKLYLGLFVLILGHIINYMHTIAYIRMILNCMIYLIVYYFIFKEKISKAICVVLISYLMIFVSETIFSIIYILIKSWDNVIIIISNFNTVFSNIIIAIMTLLLSLLKPVKIFAIRVADRASHLSQTTMLIMVLLLMLSINLLNTVLYYKIDLPYLLLLNLLLVFIYTYIVMSIINEKNKNIQVQSQYEAMAETCEEYEDLADRQRVRNHESKNQLLVIKSMIEKKEKGTIDYITHLIKDYHEDNEIFFEKTKKIPSGGLQGLIYKKMLIMGDYKIAVNLEVSRQVKKLKLDSLDVATKSALYKTVGVFLDNAIQAVNKLKEKTIGIEIYEENEQLYISISNNFEGLLEIDRMDELGYSTNGEGHGYGLGLVKELIAGNPRLTNIRSINGNIFTQVIAVTLPKKGK